MNRNVGTLDRLARGLGAAGLLAAAVLAPLPLLLRVPLFGGLGLYLLATSATARCLGYRLMGRSTCPVDAK